jgi:N utilization substance protein B
MAMQMLYQMELGGSSLVDIFAAFDHESYVLETDLALAEPDEAPSELSGVDLPKGARIEHAEAVTSPPEPAPKLDRALLADAFAYARRLAEGVSGHGETIDDLIRRYAENWRLERMPIIDRNILRLAIYEMLHEANVPRVVIVDEAIELAKKFGSENSGRFVNGLLDGVLKSGDAIAASGEDSQKEPV